MTNTKKPTAAEQHRIKLSPVLIDVGNLLGFEDDPAVQMAKLVHCIGESVANGMFPHAVGLLTAGSADTTDPVFTGYVLAPIICQLAATCRESVIYQEIKGTPELKLWEEQMTALMPERPEFVILGFLRALADYTKLLKSEDNKNVLNSLMVMVAVNLPAIFEAAEALTNELKTPERLNAMTGCGMIKFIGDIIPIVVADFPDLLGIDPKTSVSKLFSIEFMSKMDDALALTLQVSELCAHNDACAKCTFDESGLIDRLIELCDMVKDQKCGKQLLSIASELPPAPAGDDEARENWREAWLLMGVRQGLYNGMVKGKHNPNYAFQVVVRTETLCVIVLGLLGIRHLLTKSDCNCKRGVELLAQSQYVRPTK